MDRESVLYRALPLVVAAVMLVVSMACRDDSAPGLTASPGTSPSQTANGVGFGPLAVLDSGGGGPSARGGTGPIHIDGNCVTVTVENGEVRLLVWQSANVRWDDQNEVIIFSSVAPVAETITLRDGDTITVGGASMDGDVPVARELDWLATPQPSCSGEKWFVSGVIKE